MHLKGIKERRMQIIFGAIILATVPCYVLGFGLLRMGRGDDGSAPPPTLTASPGTTATRPILQRTRFPTFTPSPSPSVTPTFTASPEPSPTQEPSPTASATATPLPTSTETAEPSETVMPAGTTALTESPTPDATLGPE